MSPFPPEIFGWSLEETSARQLRGGQGLESQRPIGPSDPEEEERHFKKVLEETRRRREARLPVFDDPDEPAEH